MSFGDSIPRSVKVQIPTDEKGLMGRECPKPDCLGYFKVQFGTGLKGKGLPCHCPYCGHIAQHDKFWTPEQLRYARSVALRKVTDAFHNELKKLEFDHRPRRGGFGIGVSMRIERGTPVPIRQYREKQLETEVVCSICTLHYAIYGVFGFCPDCGNHNSPQILQKNLEIATKELDLAGQIDDADFREHLVGDALENVVSAFDGFGRQTCVVMKTKAANPNSVRKISFQNILAAEQDVRRQFAVNLSGLVSCVDWGLIVRCFQKRHLLAHKMGVIDDKYVAVANDPQARIGRKVSIEPEEVRTLIAAVDRLGVQLAQAVGLQVGTP